MIEIGRGKRALPVYSFDNIAIVPSRRTRGIEEVNLAWRIDALTFDYPIIAAPMDSIMSPQTAIAVGKLGGLGVLNLEGLWTRYPDPEPVLSELAGITDQVAATKYMQRVYAEPVKAALIEQRLDEIRQSGVPVAGSLSPANCVEFGQVVEKAGVDFFVIRGSMVSAEHVSTVAEPLNLKEFIYNLDVPVLVGGCASYLSALHLMRTGAAGVLVGFGGGSTARAVGVLGIEVPMASALADVTDARREYLDESGGRYVQVIADGGLETSGDIAKAIAIGADAVMVGTPLARAFEAPGRGWHWGAEAWNPTLPRGERVHFEQIGSLEEVLLGPSATPDGTMNLVGALRKALAATGYSDIKEFQRVDVVVRQ
ncbi:MAG: GuaB3 family IMP dehydrogenase-related protein [Propionibacteriaceae bacterium]|jgi:IMP dehydrogenase|nr:GuaB3 family IMP dehydrogenase-related protein [Propionibacteriaceae bacterium]